MFESAALRYEADEFPDIKVGAVEHRECMRGSLVTWTRHFQGQGSW